MSATQEQLSQAANAGEAVQKPVEDLHLKRDNIRLGDDDKFNDVSETRATFTAKDDVKPSEPFKPVHEDTKAHVCCPDDDTFGRTNNQIDFKVWDADFDDSTARKIKTFMAHPTDPNS